ncbi:MAG: hypothetical protein Kow0029_04620 [Candidatus Rifleibacteriota bacterium]
MPEIYVKKHGKTAQIDWLRACEFYELGAKTDSFIFPKPLAIKGDEITYEKLEAFRRLPNCLDLANVTSRMSQIGKALALIHEKQDPVDHTKIRLHSDFGLRNLLWHRQKDRLIVTDPVFAKFYWYESYYGDRHFDLAELTWTIFVLRNFPVEVAKSPKMPQIMVKTFFESYEAATGIRIDLKKVEAFALKINRSYYKNRISANKAFYLAMPLLLFLMNKMKRVLRNL